MSVKRTGSRPIGPRNRSSSLPSSVPASPTSPMPISLGHSTVNITGATHTYSPICEDDDAIEQLPIIPNRRQQTNLAPEAAYGDSRMSRRSQYLSLSEAVHDGSQPDFNPEKLYPAAEDGMVGVGKGSLSATDFHDAQPSPSLFPRGLPKPHRKHPFASSFEAPEWRHLIIHVVLCLIAYPILQIFIIIARNKSLFWARLFVGAGCGLLGFILGISLLRLGRSILEAATWATVIHQSKIPDGPGVKLRDLAAHTHDPTSSLSALRLLWDRHTYPGAARDHRRKYDRRPWTIFILFFLMLVALAAFLSFIFGRVVSIETSVKWQHETYEEISIKGDMSEGDLKRASQLLSSFDDFRITWTLAPFSANGGLPSVVSFPWDDDTVYFAETIHSQLVPDGSGFGTFDEKTTEVSTEVTTDDDGQQQQRTVAKKADRAAGVEPGSTLRFPRWGIRIKCAKLTDSDATLIPLASNSSLTYVFVPRDTLQGLFSEFDMSLPDKLKAPLNISNPRVLNPLDTLPSTIKPEDLALSAQFSGNGVAHSLYSNPISMGEDGNGWVSLEAVLIRMNTTFAPNGTFLRYSDQSVPDMNGNLTWIGYDAAICLELYEPWVLEVYNSTVGAPSSTRIISKGPVIEDDNSQDTRERRHGPKLGDNSNIKSRLNSTALSGAYLVAHQNSVNKILKDNGRDAFYVPSPTILSYCDANPGASGYTELSVDRFARARALADASNVLPYFAGSGDSLARRYPDRVLSSANIQPVEMVIVLVVVLMAGVIAALFVPKLPLSVPKRGFELYSWMAAFYADELVGERPTVGIGRNMEINDIANQVGNLKFRYVS